jgi:hypothetical protein
VLVLDPKLRATLRGAGSEATVDQLAATAQTEQRRFFDAIAALACGSSRAGAARLYLVDLGVLPESAPLAAPATAPAAVMPPYQSIKVFAGGAALSFAEARTRNGNQYTLNVEGALALGGSQKAYDWPNKIVVQLTVQEAYQVLALFENKLQLIKFDGHGRTHDKSLQIEHQKTHYYVRLIQRGRAAVAVPVRAVDAIGIVSLLYKRLLLNEPHLQIDHIRAMVDRMAAMMAR